METTQPRSTSELPIASIENFANFIISDRDGYFNESHLQAVFAMKVSNLTAKGLLPGEQHLSQTGKDYYRAKIYVASETIRESLGVDDMGDWGVKFETLVEAEAFIGEQASLFADILEQQLKEENNG